MTHKKTCSSYRPNLFQTSKCLGRVTVFPTVQKHLHGKIFVQWCITIIDRGSVSSNASKVRQTALWTIRHRDLPVHNWYKEFQFGRTTFEGSERCCQPVTAATEQNVAKVKCLDKGHPRITENEIKDSFNISSGSLNRIFRHHPGIWKRCTRWIPPQADRGTEEG